MNYEDVGRSINVIDIKSVGKIKYIGNFWIVFIFKSIKLVYRRRF